VPEFGALRLFYAPDVGEPSHMLEGEELTHLVKALRGRVGDAVGLLDGRGGVYEGTVTAIGRRHAALATRLLRRNPRPFPALTLVVAPPRAPERWEWILEKATECGATTIAPVWSARTERRPERLDRWQRIVAAASKQAERTWLPDIVPLRPFDECLAAGWGDASQAFIAHCSDYGRPKPLLSSVLVPNRSAWVAVGPEGDFTREEVEAAVGLGAVEVSLGTCRLRTETAALAVALAFRFANDAHGT